MAKFSPKAGKSPRAVSRTPSSAFVLGSRPANLRQPGIQRVKPGPASTTQYGKMDNVGAGDTDSLGGLS